jgi:hypothetical protein
MYSRLYNLEHGTRRATTTQPRRREAPRTVATRRGRSPAEGRLHRPDLSRTGEGVGHAPLAARPRVEHVSGAHPSSPNLMQNSTDHSIPPPQAQTKATPSCQHPCRAQQDAVEVMERLVNQAREKGWNLAACICHGRLQSGCPILPLARAMEDWHQIGKPLSTISKAMHEFYTHLPGTQRHRDDVEEIREMTDSEGTFASLVAGTENPREWTSSTIVTIIAQASYCTILLTEHPWLLAQAMRLGLSSLAQRRMTIKEEDVFKNPVTTLAAHRRARLRRQLAAASAAATAPPLPVADCGCDHCVRKKPRGDLDEPPTMGSPSREREYSREMLLTARPQAAHLRRALSPLIATKPREQAHREAATRPCGASGQRGCAHRP